MYGGIIFMKKMLSVALAGTLMFSMSLPAYAGIAGQDSEGNPILTSPVDGDAQWVSADSFDDNLEVSGDITGSWGDSVKAENGAKIYVEGDVSEHCQEESHNAISVSGEAFVATYGNVYANGSGDAIAANGGKADIAGSVIQEDGRCAIVAENYSLVRVGEDVSVSNTTGHAIDVDSKSMVIVGGDVTTDGEIAINAFGDGIVIVEGVVTGGIQNKDGESVGDIYLGQLNGAYDDLNVDLNSIHYLIGTDPSGKKMSAVTLSGFFEDDSLDGVKEHGYKYTSTADPNILKGKTITLKPAEGKILAVSGFDGANVTYVANDDGSVTFTFGDNFKGGLQDLVLLISDKPNPGPDPEPTPEPTPKHSSHSKHNSSKQPVKVAAGPVQYAETGKSVENYVINDATGSNRPLPYITTDESVVGWQTVDEALDAHKAKSNGTFSITMNGSTTIDPKLIVDAHDKEIPLEFVLDNDVKVGIPTANSVLSNQVKEGKAVYFNASSMTTAEAVSIGKPDAGLLPSDIAAIGGDENTPVVLTLCSNDKLSTKKSQLMTISFNAKAAGFNPGDEVYLYCGTSQIGIAMYKTGRVDENGYVTFDVPMVDNYWTIGRVNLKNTLLRN